jgi:hypothetical protein
MARRQNRRRLPTIRMTTVVALDISRRRLSLDDWVVVTTDLHNEVVDEA